MTPYYERDGITIYHGDCRVFRGALTSVPTMAVVSDPPYGMKWNTDSTRFTGGGYRAKQQARGESPGRADWLSVHGDDAPFDPRPWLQAEEVILWGANHYAPLLPCGTTLVWIKKSDNLFGSFLSDAEVGWQKGGHGVYCFRKHFPPPSRIAEGSGVALHPNQKPIALMQWCISRTTAAPILDPFMGSGTTLVAAKNLGRRAIGIEIEEKYCEIAARRLDQGVLDFGGAA